MALSEQDQKMLKNMLIERSQSEGEHRIWTGTLSQGSASFVHGKRTYQAKRLSLQLSGKDVSKVHMVKNTCSESRCILPDHLIAIPKVTQANEPSEANFLRAKLLLMKYTKKEDGHLIWLKKDDNDDEYGKGFTFFGKKYSCYKASWMLANQKMVPPGLVVRHKCDVKLCIDPEHLEIGTYQDNSDDRKRDGTNNEGEDRKSVV